MTPRSSLTFAARDAIGACAVSNSEAAGVSSVWGASVLVILFGGVFVVGGGRKEAEKGWRED